ncbi:MAG TPA: hypothetical protein VEL76_18335 [Gemmataceae bacterium]|nr:hypothetical protein [Gemmataceae bacterium]
MASVRVPAFTPSTSGFHFANNFEDAPVLTILVPPFGEIPVGSAAGGLCGGMVFAALDLFHQGTPPPPDRTAPRPGTPLFQYIARRLLDSFNGVAGVFKYLEWMRLPEDGRLFGLLKSIGWHTVHGEWPAIRADLDAGRPCPLGLLKVESLNPLDVGNNHQVLAYGYDLDEAAGTLKILVYDPNCPDQDDVTLTVNVSDPANPSRIVYSADPKGRGFFRTRYAPGDPPALSHR